MKIGDFIIGDQIPFVIAEIGHNHQGSLDKAKEMIFTAHQCGASAVKLQKRFNKILYTAEFYNKPYDNVNSYGATYGEHRDKLEFNFDQYVELKNYADALKILFFATPFDFPSVEFLEKVDVPCYKIASGDLQNTPLQEFIASTYKPLFLSTGGGTIEDIKRAVDAVTKYHHKISIMHCTASYPTEIQDMNLNAITTLIKSFPEYPIGLSDHENGIDAASIAFMLGARAFEKHFTLNRAWKGTDQSFSLEPTGLKKLIRNLNRIPTLLGSHEKKMLDCEAGPLLKMRKKIVANSELPKDHILNSEDLAIKSPGDGLPPYYLEKIIGRKLKRSLKTDETVTLNDLYE